MEHRDCKDTDLVEKDDRLQKLRNEIRKLNRQKSKLLTAIDLAVEARSQFNRHGFYGQKQIAGIFEAMDLAIQDCKSFK